ncbi:hypothetical protein BU16DRAFT_521761 [Lophium mytilinum]|uniref:Uncharacterized protein n=1 Tax=Lophium mytilinum TaxID=390894 RepID=A0A6A6RFL8_9PEZI|nr:hypothetical protein BU16DRAFT_521761 [Lophium mytilinum]
MAVRPPQSPWLAISFAGCCASAELRDEKEAALRANSPVEMQICYDQPRAVELPRAEPEHPRPVTSHSMSRHVSQWVMSGRDTMSRASIRTNSSTVKRPWVAHSKGRPSISGPTDFRRVEGLDTFQEEAMPVRRRRSFRPLELSIYVDNGRLSPLPDFAEAEWSSLPAGLEFPAQARVRSSSKTDSISSNTSYNIQRKPVGSIRSSISSTISRPTSTHLLQNESFCQSPSTFQRSGTMSSLASPRTPLSRLPSPSRARSYTDAPHSLTKRGSLRRAKTDVEREIRELNTIVEDRRADARLGPSATFPNIPPPSPSHHVPAIAPSLRMHVRSETLSDIGSAFSVPFVSKPLPSSPLPNARSRSQSSSPTPSLFATRTKKLKLIPPPLPPPPRQGPLNSNPITPPTPTVPTPTTPLGRLGAWLKRSIPSTPTTPTSAAAYKISNPIPQQHSTPTPFYQCTPQPTQQQSHHHSGSESGTQSLLSRPHTRQASAETGTVTLLSCPSTPALSSRTASPSFEDEAESGRFRFGPGSPETPGGEMRGALGKEMGVVVDLKMVGIEGDEVGFVSPVSPVGVAF